VGDGHDGITVLLEDFDDAVPARRIGERAMNEHDGRFAGLRVDAAKRGCDDREACEQGLHLKHPFVVGYRLHRSGRRAKKGDAAGSTCARPSVGSSFGKSVDMLSSRHVSTSSSLRRSVWTMIFKASLPSGSRNGGRSIAAIFRMT